MRLQKGTDYPPFGMNELERNFEVQNIVCRYDTISAEIFAIDDNFSSCNGSWTATASATVLCTNSQLQIFNTSTSSKNIGAIKTFTGGTGLHSVSFRLDDNICKNYVVWPPSNSPKPITVYIRDAANNVVASQNYTSTGNNTIFSFTYTPASAGTHTMEFYMANATALCYFFINDVTVQYDSVRVDTICEDLGAGYRFAFGGHEKDNEVHGNANWYTFGDYGYDPRIVQRPRTEPLTQKFPNLSPYVAFGNNPIRFIDPDGREPVDAIGDPIKDLLNYAQKKVTQAATNLAVAAGRAMIGLATSYVEHKLDQAVNSNDPFKSSVALTTEFITGLGPAEREFGPDHPFTQSLAKSNLTTEALKAFQTGYDDYKAGKRKDMPSSYRVDFNYGVGGDTGPFKEFFKDGEFTAAQFTGTANFMFDVDKKGNLNISVFDTKTEYSFLYHAAGTDRHTRSEGKIMGETTQTYEFSIPLNQVKERTGKK